MIVKSDAKKDLEYYAKLPYTIILEQWDDGKGAYWVARVAELPHCLIHADTPEGAVREIEEVKRDWIKSNLERGLRIPEPNPRKYSGRMMLRISPSLHKLLAFRAEIEGMSLNQYMATALATSAGLDVEHRESLKGSLAAHVKMHIPPGEEWDKARDAAWRKAARRKAAKGKRAS